MSQPPTTIQIAYWQTDPRSVNLPKIHLEKSMQGLAQIQWIDVPSLESAFNQAIDLIVIAAESIPKEHFWTWLTNLETRFEQQGWVWVPALILNDVEYQDLRIHWQKLRRSNWYFDIIHRDHVASAPMRTANLLRMKEHLQELRRYDAHIKDLEKRLSELTSRVEAMTPKT